MRGGNPLQALALEGSGCSAHGRPATMFLTGNNDSGTRAYSSTETSRCQLSLMHAPRAQCIDETGSILLSHGSRAPVRPSPL